MTTLLTDDDVRNAIDVPGVLQVLERAHRDEFLGNTAITDRVDLRFGSEWLRLMAASLPELGVVDYKEFHPVGSEVRFQIRPNVRRCLPIQELSRCDIRMIHAPGRPLENMQRTLSSRPRLCRTHAPYQGLRRHK